MRHRKLKHTTFVKRCDKFIKNICQFQNSYCWWLHDEEEAMEIDECSKVDENEVPEDKNEKKENEKADNTPVFQKLSVNLKPPIIKKKTE